MKIAETAAAVAQDLSGDCVETGLSGVSISGSDAAAFLQGQLTIDVTNLPIGQHRLAAWCNAKGRIWALLRLWRTDQDSFTALLPAPQREAFIKRLRMFVLRAQVSVDPDDMTITGHCGALPGATGAVTALDGGCSALILSATHSLIVGDTSNDTTLDAPTWHWRCMVAGEPQLRPAEQEQHIPQSLNLVEAGAVDFNKGCYPGQEIVARVHYRGRAPQMLDTLYWTDQEPVIDGQEIARATHAGITVCQVVIKRPTDG